MNEVKDVYFSGSIGIITIDTEAGDRDIVLDRRALQYILDSEGDIRGRIIQNDDNIISFSGDATLNEKNIPIIDNWI